MSSSSSITSTRRGFTPDSYLNGCSPHATVRNTPRMARILIADPHPDIGPLFARMVTRLGHEPVIDESAPVDVAIVDVDSVPGRERARARHESGVAVVCVSIYSPCAEWIASMPGPFLVKPFL